MGNVTSLHCKGWWHPHPSGFDQARCWGSACVPQQHPHCGQHVHGSISKTQLLVLGHISFPSSISNKLGLSLGTEPLPKLLLATQCQHGGHSIVSHAMLPAGQSGIKQLWKERAVLRAMQCCSTSGQHGHLHKMQPQPIVLLCLCAAWVPAPSLFPGTHRDSRGTPAQPWGKAEQREGGGDAALGFLAERSLHCMGQRECPMPSSWGHSSAESTCPGCQHCLTWICSF